MVFRLDLLRNYIRLAKLPFLALFSQNLSTLCIHARSPLFVLISSLSLTSLHGSAGYFLPWGKDASLIEKEDYYPTPPKREDLLHKTAESLILFHQHAISPLHGSRSNFRPTSSRYMLLAMRRYGWFIGYLKGCDRLLRENKDPWVYRTRKIHGKLYKWDPTIVE